MRTLYSLVFICFSVFIFSLFSTTSSAQTLDDIKDVDWHENDYYVGGGIHGTLLAGAGGRSVLNPRFGWAVRGGKRWGRWAGFVQLEQDLWLASDFENNVTQGVLNPGIGLECRYIGGFLATSIAAGPSILLFDTALDDAGQVGFFFDIRPTGMRFRPIDSYEDFILKVEPLTMTFVVPVLTGIPLIQVEYRTVVSVELAL